MKIAIRMDDITPNMDWEKFNRFKALLDEHDIKPLIGVVPDNADPHLNICGSFATDEPDRDSEDGKQHIQDFWAYVKDLQNAGWIIAMHGMSHIYTTSKGGMFPLNNFSEFAGLPYDEQLELLGYGVDIFNAQGIEADIFMAPAHSYDANTISALKTLGFSKITDGFGNKPYNYKGLTFYPISFKRSQTLKGGEGYSTFVYHANEMNDKDFESFEHILKENSNDNFEVISFNEYLDVSATERTVLGHIKEYLMAKGKHIIGLLR